MPPAARDTCPICRRSLPDFGGWPPWCADCGWGLEPEDETPARSTRFSRWWQGRKNAAEQAESQRLLADPALLRRPHPRRTAIYAAALAVHAVTVALLAAGVWVMTTDIVTVLKIGAGIVTFGLVAITFPTHRLRPPAAAKRADATATLAVAAAVAGSVGVAAPKRVQVTSYAHPAPAGSPRTLTIDSDRWGVLGAAGRVALLAHELAHGHDPRRGLLVTIASETFDGWLALLRPDPHARAARRRSVRNRAEVRQRTFVGVTELIVPLALSPLFAIVLGMGWVLREGATVAGLRAELYADALAAAARNPDDVVELIDGEIAVLVAGGNAPAPLASLPALERERRRRIAIGAGTRLDDMHPTYAARLELLAAIRDQGVSLDLGRRARGPLTVSADDLDAAGRELAAAKS